MRKINSTFKTAFISEAGAALKNNDYFAYVELDDYACYSKFNHRQNRIRKCKGGRRKRHQTFPGKSVHEKTGNAVIFKSDE